MSNATWTRQGRPFGGKTANLGGRKTTSTSRTAAMRALGCAYDDQQVELLAFRLGDREDEQAIHLSLSDHVHHGREYYHPTSEVMGRRERHAPSTRHAFGLAMTMQAAQPTTHASLEREIADLRAKAERLSRHDPRRDAIDDKVDALVDRWLRAQA